MKVAIHLESGRNVLTRAHTKIFRYDCRIKQVMHKSVGLLNRMDSSFVEEFYPGPGGNAEKRDKLGQIIQERNESVHCQNIEQLDELVSEAKVAVLESQFGTDSAFSLHIKILNNYELSHRNFILKVKISLDLALKSIRGASFSRVILSSSEC